MAGNITTRENPDKVLAELEAKHKPKRLRLDRTESLPECGGNDGNCDRARLNHARRAC